MPDGWQKCVYSDVADINSRTLSGTTSPDYALWYLDIASIVKTGVVGEIRSLRFCDAPSRARRVVRAGDTLVSTVRPYLRSFAFMRSPPDNLVASTGFAVLSPHCGVDSEFLYQTVLRAEFVEFLKDRMKGSNYPAVGASDVAAVPLHLPPLGEQRKIAAILSSVDEAIEKTQAVIDQVQVVKKGLMQELLTKGIPGRHKKFKQTEIGEIPESWDVVLLRDLYGSDGATNGLYRPREDYGDGVPIIRIDAFQNGDHISAQGLQRLTLDAADVQRYEIRKGDILINRVNSMSHLGKTALVCNVPEPTVFESNMMRIRLAPNVILPEFAFIWLAGKFARKRWLESAKRAVAQASISQGDVGGLPMPTPPIDEQSEIVSREMSLRRRIVTESAYFQSLLQTKQALMQTLLTGELRVEPLP